MKTSTVLLVASLALNGIIAAAMWLGPSGNEPAPPTASPSAQPATPVARSPGAETWRELQAGALGEQRDRLLATGMPPHIVRAIMTAQVREGFAAQRKALTDAQADVPFWKNPTRDPQILAALRELARQEQNLLRDLLGRDPRQDDPGYAANLRRQFGDLPAEKVEQLRRIMDDYNERRMEVTGGTRGAMLPDERQRFQALEKAMHDEFATVLTPQELFEYDLRSSNTAMQLRNNLAAFDVTEQEYIGLFKLQQAFDEKYGALGGPLSPDQIRQRMDAQKQLTEEIKNYLGPRFAEYERATDFGYRQTSQLVARLNLPAETANAVYSLQKSSMEAAGRIRSDRSLDQASREAQLDQLAADVETRLVGSLGATGLEAYRQNGMGAWLTVLQARPGPGPGGAAPVPAINR